MDIFAVLSSLMATTLKKRFKELVEAKVIDLSFFGDENKYQLAARDLMGKMAGKLTALEETDNAFLDISVFAYLLHAIESETTGEVIATGLGFKEVEEPVNEQLKGGQSVCGPWGATPVSLNDADNALRGNPNHTPERFDSDRQTDIGLLSAEGVVPHPPKTQFDQD
jgi:hypothetical protein